MRSLDDVPGGTAWACVAAKGLLQVCAIRLR